MSYTNTGNMDEGFAPAMLWYPKYTKQAYRKNMFNLTLNATSSGVAAGNIVGAAAAASTNFGLINPSTSGMNCIFTKFQVGVISGTPGPGPVFHGVITTLPSAASPGGTIKNCFLADSTASKMKAWAIAAGSALTGGTAPTIFRPSDFSSTATAQASVFEVKTTEIIDGDIILPPGVMWLPLWSVAGTSLLCSYSITWIEQGI
jgi:hypothetical protein